jgi:hypothetical protein
MLHNGLELNACLRLLGEEVQRAGKLIIWFSSNLGSGNQRWAAIYEYKSSYYSQSTDAGQTGPYAALSGAFARTISDIDMSSLKIGGISMPSKVFIELLSSKLDPQKIEAVANKMLASDDFEESAPGDITIEEFFHHRETANGTGSIFQLWPGDDPEEWENNFAELPRANGRTLYISSWDGGMCANGSECIEEFLGHYWGSKTNDGICGPYESFADVFEDEYLG